MKLAVLLSVALLCSCGDLTVADTKQEVVLKKEELKDYVLVNRQDLEQLKADASIGKSVGRYHQYREGMRTFRLDTATGQNCILLTTDWDWKNPDVSSQNCANIDWLAKSSATASART